MNNTPIELLNAWLSEEQHAGAPSPKQAVLSTCSKGGAPHARVVAIREINEQSLLFFTQRNTRKVTELLSNPFATITFWFELLQREVIIEGGVYPLSEIENEQYWQANSRESHIRFTTYAPTSSQPITSKEVLENRKKLIENEFEGKALPVSPFYCGFRLNPIRIMFYAIRTDELSDVFEYVRIDDAWRQQWLSP